MTKARIYTKNQAFNTVYKERSGSSQVQAGDFEAPKKYHHDPDKLAAFTDYTAYVKWSNELYASSTKLISILREIYNASQKARSSWYESKNKLNFILSEYDDLKLDLEDLYDDIFEFQNCMLSTSIHEKHAEIEALSDQVRYLAALENKIIETCNRKLYEISTSRVTYANLFVATVALVISALTLNCSR